MRTVVVGLGNQGKKRLRVAGSECVATVDPFNPEAQFKTIEEVELSSYDSALICTPDKENEKLVNYCLRNKKHVLVEKPFSAPPAILQDFRGMAESSGLALYTAYNHRYEPNISRLKEEIATGKLGEIYLAKFFYGNGTARNVRDSAWKDVGSGVLGDLGCHLLDLSSFLLGHRTKAFKPILFRNFENKSLDHAIFGTESAEGIAIQMETSLLSWKNAFTIDLFAAEGSLHLNGLCKWGPSILTMRKRTWPSGPPTETFWKVEGPDTTWETEYNYFKNLCRTGGNEVPNDIWIHETLDNLFKWSIG